MVVRRWIAYVAIVVGTILVGGAVFFATNILPGLSLGALSSLLPSWAITAQVSHTVATLAASPKIADIETIVATLDRFAASHGFVRDEDEHMKSQPPDPTHLRLFYTSSRANLSFYTTPGQARLAVVSEPGRSENLTSLVAEAQSTFAPLGFTVDREP